MLKHKYFELLDAHPDLIPDLKKRVRLTEPAPRVTFISAQSAAGRMRGTAGERAMGGKERAGAQIKRSERQIAEAGIRRAKADLKSWEARLQELAAREAAEAEAAD